MDASGNHQDFQEVVGNALEMASSLKHGRIPRQIILAGAPAGLWTIVQSGPMFVPTSLDFIRLPT